MSRVDLDEPVAALLGPLWAALEPALERLPAGPALRVEVGAVAGSYAVRDGVLDLSEALLAEGLHHPAEPEGLVRLDRWRRAACSVLEGVALSALAEATGVAIDLADWRQVGVAIHVADLACPELQLCIPDMLLAARTASPGASPRAGVAVYRALRSQGVDGWAQAVRWLRGEEQIEGTSWLAWGAWTLGAGLASEVALPVDTPPAVDIPVSIPPWSWVRLDVPENRRGGLVRTDGDAVITHAWAEGGRRLRTLAGALGGGGRLEPELGGPIGSWDCVSAHGFGQVFGVRGMNWSFKRDGRVELVLADAFAGPPDSVEMAKEVGTSGVVPGRWQVAGPSALRFAGLVTTNISMHGRGGDRFAVPAGQLGMANVLQAMQGPAWRWRVTGGELFLTGPMMGGQVEMRLVPA